MDEKRFIKYDFRPHPTICQRLMAFISWLVTQSYYRKLERLRPLNTHHISNHAAALHH